MRRFLFFQKHIYTNTLQIYLKPLSLKRLLVLFSVKYLSLNFYRELLRARLNMAGSPTEIRPAGYKSYTYVLLKKKNAEIKPKYTRVN